MTSDGSAYTRFRRALLTKNPGIVLPADAELEHVSLDDALKILVVLAEERHPGSARGRTTTPTGTRADEAPMPTS